MATIVGPPIAGVTGAAEGTKVKRVDFRRYDFINLIESKGPRFAWARGTPCPCKAPNDQTKQPDPSCPLCKGVGWIYFGPKDYVVNDSLLGDLNPIQRALIARDNSAVIRGVMSNARSDAKPYTQVGNWVSGMMNFTVRHENKISYYDRIIGLDGEIPYAETVETGTNPLSPLALRYPATGVNFVRSLVQRYNQAEDFALDDEGKIVFFSGKAPPAKTRLTVHYLCHPTWIIWEWPHVIRETTDGRKVGTPITPLGNPQPLPLQAVVQLEFLIP